MTTTYVTVDADVQKAIKEAFSKITFIKTENLEVRLYRVLNQDYLTLGITGKMEDLPTDQYYEFSGGSLEIGFCQGENKEDWGVSFKLSEFVKRAKLQWEFDNPASKNYTTKLNALLEKQATPQVCQN